MRTLLYILSLLLLLTTSSFALVISSSKLEACTVAGDSAEALETCESRISTTLLLGSGASTGVIEVSSVSSDDMEAKLKYPLQISCQRDNPWTTFKFTEIVREFDANLVEQWAKGSVINSAGKKNCFPGTTVYCDCMTSFKRVEHSCSIWDIIDEYRICLVPEGNSATATKAYMYPVPPPQLEWNLVCTVNSTTDDCSTGTCVPKTTSSEFSIGQDLRVTRHTDTILAAVVAETLPSGVPLQHLMGQYLINFSPGTDDPIGSDDNNLLIVPSTLVSTTGSDCDRIGQSARFYTLAEDFCEQPPNTCTPVNTYELIRNELELAKQGETPHYLWTYKGGEGVPSNCSRHTSIMNPDNNYLSAKYMVPVTHDIQFLLQIDGASVKYTDVTCGAVITEVTVANAVDMASGNGVAMNVTVGSYCNEGYTADFSVRFDGGGCLVATSSRQTVTLDGKHSGTVQFVLSSMCSANTEVEAYIEVYSAADVVLRDTATVTVNLEVDLDERETLLKKDDPQLVDGGSSENGDGIAGECGMSVPCCLRACKLYDVFCFVAEECYTTMALLAMAPMFIVIALPFIVKALVTSGVKTASMAVTGTISGVASGVSESFRKSSKDLHVMSPRTPSTPDALNSMFSTLGDSSPSPLPPMQSMTPVDFSLSSSSMSSAFGTPPSRNIFSSIPPPLLDEPELTRFDLLRTAAMRFTTGSSADVYLNSCMKPKLLEKYPSFPRNVSLLVGLRITEAPAVPPPAPSALVTYEIFLRQGHKHQVVRDGELLLNPVELPARIICRTVTEDRLPKGLDTVQTSGYELIN